MGTARKNKQGLTEKIVGQLARRHSTAVVLFHHAVAERLGLAQPITSASTCCANEGR